MLNIIFKESFLCMCSDSKRNRQFRWLNINCLKEKFFSEYIVKVIRQTKSQITTSLGNAEANLESKKPIMLDDDDINTMFGLSLFKVQKWLKLNRNDSDDTTQEEKRKIVSEIYVFIPKIQYTMSSMCACIILEMITSGIKSTLRWLMHYIVSTFQRYWIRWK